MKNILSLLLMVVFVVTPIYAQYAESGNLKDVEENTYKTVIINNEEWMAENLKTTLYNDGTPISEVKDDDAWAKLLTGAYCWFDNNREPGNIYGALYNWYAVSSGNLCPKGWHVPSDEEWRRLENYVVSKSGVDSLYLRRHEGVAGSLLKSESGWYSNGNGSDKYGFNALPGGERSAWNGKFYLNGKNGYWWSGTELNERNAFFRSLIYALDDVSRNDHDKKFGFTVRCVKNK